MNKNQVYQIVTDRIIEQLQQGIIPWTKPWTGDGSAYNGKSKKPYSLLNQLLLKHPGAYLTFNQIKEMNGRIIKGAKAEIVVFWKMYQTDEPLKDENGNIKQDNNGNTIYKTLPVLRYYQVFWTGDTTLKEQFETTENLINNDPIKAGENIINNYLLNNPELKLENDKVSNQAYYAPLEDKIVLPTINQFPIVEEYYSTAFHEMTHSTGAKHRLDRLNITAHFGDETYSKEELVAEIGSAYLMNKANLETTKTFKNSVAYLQGWINKLKKDNTLIVSACSKAEKAVDFITEGLEDYQAPQEENKTENLEQLAQEITSYYFDPFNDDFTLEEEIQITKDLLINNPEKIIEELDNWLDDGESDFDQDTQKFIERVKNFTTIYNNNLSKYYPELLV